MYTVELLEGQAYADNKDRRNRFYARFGLRFEFTDEEQRAGRSTPLRAKELVDVDSWRRNIEVRDPLDLIGHVLKRMEAAELEAKLAKARLRMALADVKRESALPPHQSRSWTLLLALIVILVLWLAAR